MEQNMIVHNKIQGILPCALEKEMGFMTIQYEIDGRTSLLEYVKKNQITYQELSALFHTFLEALKDMKKYFIIASRLLLEEECIFLENHTKKIEFCCLPGHPLDPIIQLKMLTEFLLKHVDHKEQKAVLLIYGFYQLLEQNNVSIAMVESYIKEELKKKEIELELPKMNQKIEEKQEVKMSIEKKEKFEEENQKNQEEIGKYSIEEGGKEQEKEKNTIFIRKNRDILSESKQKRKKSNTKESYERIKKSDQRKQIIHYSIQAINLMLCIIFLIFTILFFLKQKWKNAVIGIMLVGVALYFIWERQKAYRKTNPRKEEGKKERIRIKKEASLKGEETILLSQQVEEVKVGRKMPYLKPNNKGKNTIIIYQTPLVIGSLEEAVDVVIKEKGVSRLHLSIEKEEEQFYIRDLNSTNGTKWNGELLKAQVPKALQQGDTITIGEEEYQFLL